MQRFTDPSYLTLDSAALVDGQPYDAHIRTTGARNANALFGQGRPLVTAAYGIAGAGTETGGLLVGAPERWEFVGPWQATKRRRTARAVASMIGQIAGATSVKAQFVATWPFDPEGGSTLAGTGAYTRYRAGGADFEFGIPYLADAANIFLAVRGDDTGNRVDKNNNTHGKYDALEDEVTHIYLQARAGSGVGGTGVIDFQFAIGPESDNMFVGIRSTVASTDWLLPPARVIRVLSATEAYIEPGWDLAAANVARASSAVAGVGPYYEMRSTTSIQIAGIGIYEARMDTSELRL